MLRRSPCPEFRCLPLRPRRVAPTSTRGRICCSWEQPDCKCSLPVVTLQPRQCALPVQPNLSSCLAPRPVHRRGRQAYAGVSVTEMPWQLRSSRRRLVVSVSASTSSSTFPSPKISAIWCERRASSEIEHSISQTQRCSRPRRRPTRQWRRSNRAGSTSTTSSSSELQTPLRSMSSPSSGMGPGPITFPSNDSVVVASLHRARF